MGARPAGVIDRDQAGPDSISSAAALDAIYAGPRTSVTGVSCAGGARIAAVANTIAETAKRAAAATAGQARVFLTGGSRRFRARSSAATNASCGSSDSAWAMGWRIGAQTNPIRTNSAPNLAPLTNVKSQALGDRPSA